MSDGCSYDCSQRPRIEFDSDITGTGVVIGYVGAAGIAVILIISHYLVAYEPRLDPFRDESNVGCRALPFRPNAVDLMVLRWSYLNTPLTKSILAMSDLQLATGTAILVSGYIQLRCGLSSYHWLIITRLAWFSSLTHLSCLTFLRNYLYNHKSQRQWRLVFMLVLVIMLITGMALTGSYDWTSREESEILGYAMCLFSTSIFSGSLDAFISMIILVLLIGLGFLFRVVKLHKPLSLFMIETLRRHISQCLRSLLWILYRWKGHSKQLPRVTGVILYYPALALFLSLRLVADHFSSMFFEVYWLLASFLIGLSSLLRTLNVLYPDPNFRTAFDGMDSQKWSFGQVMPVILLATPLINILESFYPDQQIGLKSDLCACSDHDLSSSIPLDIVRPSTPASFISEKFNPDQNYYLHSTAMGAGTAYILIAELAFTGFCLYYSFITTLVSAAIVLRLGFIIPPLGLWATILVSFPIDHFMGEKGNWRLGVLQTMNLLAVTVVSAGLIYELSAVPYT